MCPTHFLHTSILSILTGAYISLKYVNNTKNKIKN